jgi:hypothetical protein
MSQALGQMLGPSVRIRTETFPDEHPETVPAPARGEGTAVLSWDSPEHEHARLRVCRAPDDCLERWVTFESSDPEVERGRTLGFLAAAIVLEALPPRAAPEPTVAPPVPAPAPAPPPAAPEFPRGEISAAAAVSGPGDGTTIGAGIEGDYAWSARLRFGLAAELRFGELASAQASSRIVSLVARTSFVALRPSRATWLGAALGVGGYQLLVSHFSSDDAAPNRQERFLLGGTVGALGGLDFSKNSGLYLELAAEILAGETDIYVHDEIRASWPVVNPLARLGLRTAF